MENTTETPQQSNTFFLENSENEIKRVFDVQKAYQLHGSPIPVPERKRNLLALRETMLKYNDEVKQALFDDMGRPTNEKMSFEINVTVNDIDYALANLDEWVKPVEVEPAENKEAKGYLYYEPRGVVLLLGAWNFPFSLITTPLVGVISAGNSVIIKPNNMTPASSRVMKNMWLFSRATIKWLNNCRNYLSIMYFLPAAHALVKWLWRPRQPI
jgi:aldehyde dehydrogenase (NAD+)